MLERAQASGLDVTERTLRYYSVQGLLPAPTRGASEAADRRVRYYPESVLARLGEIRDLQQQGYSLRQIRDYLGLGRLLDIRAKGSARAADTAAESHHGAVGVVDEGTTPSDRAEQAIPGVEPRAFLEALAGRAAVEALRTFLSRAGHLRTEDAFRQAVLDYFRSLIALHVGPQHAESMLQQATASLSPVEWERLLAPFRMLRNERRVAAARQQGLPLLERLRAAAVKVVAGARVHPADQAELRALAAELQAVAERLQGLSTGFAAGLEDAGRWACQVAAALLQATTDLADALEQRDLMRVGAALQSAEAQARRLDTLMQLVHGHAELAADEEAEARRDG